MDISSALAPKSDQLDAVDLLGSPPQVFTIVEVSEGNAEQPVNVRLAEFPRVWRPSKGMLRVLAHCWGKNVKVWAGRQVELYCDPEVTFGPNKVGGIRISRLSHIEKRTAAPMIIKRGQGGSWAVDPLPMSSTPPLPDAPTPPTEAPTPPTEAAIATCTDEQMLRDWWTAFPHLQGAINERVAELRADAELVEDPS